MGLLSSHYVFHLNGNSWRVHVKMGLSKPKMTSTLTIDDENIVSDSKSFDVVAFKPQNILFDYNAASYRVEIGPVSLWDCGVHVYIDDTLIYRHKDKDFVEFKRLEKFTAKMDSLADPRPIWKCLLEGAIVGAIIGLIGSVLIIYAKNLGWLSADQNYLSWILWPAVVIAICLPARFRIIK